MKKKIIVSILLLTISSLFIGCSGTSTKKSNATASSDYPNKSIKIVVPFAAGGDTDINARIMSKYLSKELKQPVIVANIAGAAGTVGTSEVKKSKPDGYTVLMNNSAMLINSLVGMVDYTHKDFENAGIALNDNTNVFVVSAKSKFNSLKDVVEEAKKNPKKINFATSIGAPTHIQILAFEKATETELNKVDVGGAADKTKSLLSGDVDIIGTQYGVIKNYIDSGDFKCIGVLSNERNPLIPDVPTFKEQGIDLAFDKVYFYLFPKGTPKEIINTFSKAVEKVCDNKDFQDEIKKYFVSVEYSNPEKAIERIEENNNLYTKYKDLLKESKVDNKKKKK